MDRDIEIPPWAQQWLSRTHCGLQSYTLFLTYGLAAILFYTGFSTIIHTRRDKAAITADPSARAEILAESHRRITRTTRSNFFVSCIFLLHALAVWCVDAGIGIGAIWNDVDENPGVWDRSFVLELALRSVGMLAMFTAVFLVFPLLQMLGFGYLLSRYQGEPGDDSSKILGLRVLTTHLAQMWLMLGFFMVAFWPVFEYSTVRILALEAVFGSGLAWLHASFAFNFCAQSLSRTEVQPLLAARNGIKLYGKQIWIVSSGKDDNFPQYEAVAHSEPFVDEKAQV